MGCLFTFLLMSLDDPQLFQSRPCSSSLCRARRAQDSCASRHCGPMQGLGPPWHLLNLIEKKTKVCTKAPGAMVRHHALSTVSTGTLGTEGHGCKGLSAWRARSFLWSRLSTGLQLQKQKEPRGPAAGSETHHWLPPVLGGCASYGSQDTEAVSLLGNGEFL
nr:uncharacterized protein LOC119626708 [Chlorocebus sabaeus]